MDPKLIEWTIALLIEKSNIPRNLVPVWDQLRLECFEKAKAVYQSRIGYNVDHPPYEEMVYGPVSIASEAYKRVRRLTGLLSPMRTEPLTATDLNHLIDSHIDLINYLSWSYALLILATGYEGHVNSDDAEDYLGIMKKEVATDNPGCNGKCTMWPDGTIRDADPECPVHGW